MAKDQDIQKEAGRIYIRIPLFLTDFPSTKTAISLPDLVRQTNAFSKKYRPGCTPQLLDSNPKALFLHYNVKCNKKDSDPAGHDCRVQFDITKVKESQQAKDLDLQVSCSCPAFLYWGAQWNLHQRDGLLGPPRPELVAPTERLDLRANYVICKHLHAIFERILPSVQHNIVKLLRERDIRRNKEKQEKVPERLQEKQEEMKRKNELEKIRHTKDKEDQQKMVDVLNEDEHDRLLHEQQLDNQGIAPGDEEEEEEEIEETKPAPPEVQHKHDDADLHALQDLADKEENKIEEAHKEHKPHVHTGLPYEITDDLHMIERDLKNKKEKEEGWQGARVSSEQTKSAMRPQEIQRGMRVELDPEYVRSRQNNKGKHVIGTVEDFVRLERHDGYEQSYPSLEATVRWDSGEVQKVPHWMLVPAQKSLFSSLLKKGKR